jgi:hypothetical protein
MNKAPMWPLQHISQISIDSSSRMEILFTSTVLTNVPNMMDGFICFSMDREEACGKGKVGGMGRVAKGG